QTPINRFSIGIQSFFEEDLQFMNRAHNAKEASACIDLAKAEGFHNLTIDLIYGVPGSSHERWQQNVQLALEKDIPHLSCYCLTVEPQTALAHFVKAGKVTPVDEQQAASQFEYLTATLQAAGFLHYEISNFAKADYFAVHNTNYWKGVPYLGLGPSAHSFDGNSRQWNVANNAQYMKSITDGEIPCEKEDLTKVDQYNEYVMTALRTMWGCEKEKLRALGATWLSHFERRAQTYLQKGWMREQDDRFVLTTEGKLLADGIAMELFSDTE
ncbi:MAG: coproporphyrinogen-III oxidase family protein, partial [Bacteroidota bacterium]